jgi:hypothetical protein
MRHEFRRALVVAGKGVEAEIHARREHQAIVGEGRAVGEGKAAGGGVDVGSRLDHKGDALRLERVVDERLGLHRPQARDHRIAHRAGNVGGALLDEGDGEAGAAELAGAGRPREAPADDHDPGLALRASGARDERRSGP